MCKDGVTEQHKCVPVKSFCNEDSVVWMLFECLKYNGFQGIIFILLMYLSKGVEKSMLKVWNFTKSKLRSRCFDNVCSGPSQATKSLN